MRSNRQSCDRDSGFKMAGIFWNTLKVLVFYCVYLTHFVTSQSGSTCYVDNTNLVMCICTSFINGTEKIECDAMPYLPDSSFYPSNANEMIIKIKMAGSPGIPAGAFAGLKNVLTLQITGDVGDIKTGAFEDIEGVGTTSASIIFGNASPSESVKIGTIENQAFNNVKSFKNFHFFWAQIDELSRGAFTDMAGFWDVSFVYSIIVTVKGGAFETFVGGQSESAINFNYSSITGVLEGCAFVGVDEWKTFRFYQSSVEDLQNYAFAGLSNIVNFNLNSFLVSASDTSSYKGMGKVNNFILSDVNPTPVISSDPKLQDSTIAKATARETCFPLTTIAESTTVGLTTVAEAASTVGSSAANAVNNTDGLSSTTTSAKSSASASDTVSVSGAVQSTRGGSTSSTSASSSTTSSSMKAATTKGKTNATPSPVTTSGVTKVTTVTKDINISSAKSTTVKAPVSGNSTSDSSSSIGILEIVLIIICILLVIVVILLVIFLVCCRNRYHGGENKVTPDKSQTTQTETNTGHDDDEVKSKDVRPVAVLPNGYKNQGDESYYAQNIQSGSQDGLIPRKKSKKKKKKKHHRDDEDEPKTPTRIYSVPEPTPKSPQPQHIYDQPQLESYRTPRNYHEETPPDRSSTLAPEPPPRRYRDNRQPDYAELEQTHRIAPNKDY